MAQQSWQCFASIRRRNAERVAENGGLKRANSRRMEELLMKLDK